MTTETRDLTARELRRFEKQAARRYRHAVSPWSTCMAWSGWVHGFCLRCLWGTVTGAHRRAKAAHIARVRDLVRTMPHTALRRNEQGRWVRVDKP